MVIKKMPICGRIEHIIQFCDEKVTNAQRGRIYKIDHSIPVIHILMTTVLLKFQNFRLNAIIPNSIALTTMVKMPFNSQITSFTLNADVEFMTLL